MDIGKLGKLGVWRLWPELGEPARAAELAAELEDAGYGALWLGIARADLSLATPVLNATSRLVFATGILNIWTEPVAEVNAAFAAAEHPDRLLLGVGAGHREMNEDFRKPYPALVEYLDALTVPAANLALAALGPKVLRLSAERTLGAHPYLITPEHTAQARQILGDGVLLAPEQKAVLERDPQAARALARQHVGRYLGLVNYRNNLLRLGFTEEEFADGGSDRLVDALVAWGSAEDIARRIGEHHAAGADHVGLQVLVEPDAAVPVAAYREIAQASTG